MKPSLCLNMIVKNEGARIERCLHSVLPHVKSVVILDTGSTDDTVDRITILCQTAGIPYLVQTGEFKNFAQARNDAWRMAKFNNGHHTLPWCQFALFVDADMELQVDEGYEWDELLDGNKINFDMMQVAGATSYANCRIVNLNYPKTDLYVGVTHEYTDVPGHEMITRARFIDHADGSNREKKYFRDAVLLEEALKDEPGNGRYWFYLGNTYNEWGADDATYLPLARDAYQKRIDMGGWDEETHSAMMRLADVKRKMDDEAGYVAGMISAYAFRPRRAEPLFWLAEYYREKGEPLAALMFAKTGLSIPRPDDLLFVNDFAHNWGCRYEYSVAGYYDEKERNGAFQIANDLALDPTCPHWYRYSARTNLYWYTKPLNEHCPSMKRCVVHIPVPKGYVAMNPSIEVDVGGHINCNFRCVNYKIDDQGRYMIGEKECNDAPIETRNFLAKLNWDFSVVKMREIIWHRPPAKFDKVIGLEDIRLYRKSGELWFNACVREQAANGTCQQWRGKLVHDIDDHFILVKNDGPLSGEDAVEKNWMPIVRGGTEDAFIYRLDKIRYPGRSDPEVKSETKLAVGDISGGSQAIPFRHGYICVVHEASVGPDNKRTYWHRFAWFNQDLELRRLSLPFVFEEKQIEFCAGLAFHPNGSDFILSYGVRDAEAHFATVNMEEVAQMLWKFHES